MTAAECDECGCDVEVVFGEHLIDDPEGTIPEGTYVQADLGMCLDFTGHYAGFTDMYRDPRLSAVTLCHDCFLKVARVLPNAFPPGGHHPVPKSYGEASCCEFAWRINDAEDLEVGDGRGGWKPEKPEKPEKI